MKTPIFSQQSLGEQMEIDLLMEATRLVGIIPIWDAPQKPHGFLRCHELARAVGSILDLKVQDGEYCFGCEHSWLWTPQGNVLDVSCINRLPQVQLVKAGYPTAEQDRLYRGGPPRQDIRVEDVNNLISLFKVLA